jgi:phosphinothricin acetyltransferase
MLTVRDAVEGDVPAIAAIYAVHVLRGTASFEEAAPDAAEMLRRMRDLKAGGRPYLVAEEDSRVVGYAYAGPYRTRPAYRFTLENSVYVDESVVGRGIGSALLSALIERCERGPWRQMVAIIGDSANRPSIELHRKMGFRPVGTLENVGFKLGRWLDSVIMQRPLGPGARTPP